MIDLRTTLRRHRVLPVLVLEDASSAHALGAALLDGELPLAEVTLRTAAAAEAIRELAAVTGLLVGAGTVRDARQVQTAVSAGARFIVTPGFSRAVVHECAQLGVPVLPGVATATELMMALDEGVTLVKLFPASTMGGPAAVRALGAPFGDAGFVPTGGITVATMTDYLAISQVAAVGGSWIAPPDVLKSGDLDEVRRRAAQAAALAAGER